MINSSVWSKGVYYLLTVEAVIIPKLLLRSIQVTGFYLEKGETITFKLLSLRYFFLVLFVWGLIKNLDKIFCFEKMKLEVEVNSAPWECSYDRRGYHQQLCSFAGLLDSSLNGWSYPLFEQRRIHASQHLLRFITDNTRGTVSRAVIREFNLVHSVALYACPGKLTSTS